MTPSTTDKTADLGEMVDLLRGDAKQHCDQAIAQLDPDLCAWHICASDRALNAADRLAAQQREIERLTPSDPWHWKNRATKAEAKAEALEKERDALRADVDSERRGLIGLSDNLTDAMLRADKAEAEVAALQATLREIAKGETPPEQHGHYLAHREAVRLARAALSRTQAKGEGA